MLALGYNVYITSTFHILNYVWILSALEHFKSYSIIVFILKPWVVGDGYISESESEFL